MAEKFCIFCGKKPEDKNLEHVIPQWLIRLTGRERKAEDIEKVLTKVDEITKHQYNQRQQKPIAIKIKSAKADLIFMAG